MPSWVDGRPAQAASLTDRGLAYGDGLFETIGIKAGQPQLLERHLARLAEGCQRLSLAADLALIRTELGAFAAEVGEGVAKLLLTRGDGLRGYAAPPSATPRRILLSSPVPAYPSSYAEQGVRLFSCATRLAEQPLLAGLKHLNRLEQVLARSEWHDSEHAEGLMCDVSGRVIEGVFSNVFMVQGGQLITPQLDRCGVAGVMRAELLAQAQALNIPVSVQHVSLEQLVSANEVFVCNSLYGVWPVIALQGHSWPVGPLTRKLQRIALDLLDC